MAFDAFLSVDGVDSQSTRKGFESEIEITSFNWGVNNPTSVMFGEGSGSGKATLSSFNITKRTDMSSPQLFQACCLGKHFPKATVTLHKAAGENPVDYLRLDFTDVFVTDMQWAGTSGMGDDVPEESVAMTFGKVEMTYTTQKTDGTKDKAIVASYSPKTGTAD
jgi:type VI secretion system secreted protein Hcp